MAMTIGGAFQILELGMSEFTIDLSQRFFAAHGQHRVAEGDQDAEQPEHFGQTLLGKAVTKKAERLFRKMKVLPAWGGGQGCIPI